MNQMQPFYLPLLLCLASLFATPSQLVSQGYGNGVHFFEGSLQQLQTEAETQQRPYLISVYTNWCDPCQDLNNRTFTDVSLSQFINSNYLVYRLNPEYQINRSDGDLLTQYDITFYPTLLIFDANGQLMHKLSGYQSPEDLHWVLEEMLPEIPFSQPQQTASATTLLMEESAESEEDYPLFASADDGNNQLMILDQYEEAPVYDQLSSPTETDFTEPMIRDRRIGFLADDSAPAIAEAKIEEAPSPSEDLFSPPPPPQREYGVQIGVFADYANVTRNLRQMQPLFRPELQVQHSNFNGKSVFKMVFGPFENLSEAERFLRIFTRRMGMDAVIINQTY